jgi:hypothetical protein
VTKRARGDETVRREDAPGEKTTPRERTKGSDERGVQTTGERVDRRRLVSM